jgi:gamma-tubulin complex component 2
MSKLTGSGVSLSRGVGNIPGIRHPTSGSSAPNVPQTLSSLSVEQQQIILMRELLLALSGFEGEYIRVAAPVVSAASSLANASPSSIATNCPGSPYLRTVYFVMDADSADKSLISQVGQLLLLCESVVRIKDFIRVHSRYEYGLVSHAFASALQALLQDYENVVIQLECLLNADKLTLQKIVYFLQPSHFVIRLLDRLCCDTIRDVTGGLLIDLLYQSIQEQGDEKAKEIHMRLFNASAEPYFKMLQLWLFR